MTTRIVWILILISPSIDIQASPRYLMSGHVRSAASQEFLPAANIRVAGTSRGTIANADGSYALQLEAGTYTLIASSLGYRSDTARVMLTSDLTLDFTLVPSVILLPEVVVSSEDPAIEIIRRAISAKRKWLERLETYEMEAFTRQILKRDTSIASITESYTKGYWQRGDTLREIVRQRRQTKNIQPEFNIASVGRILNFSEDEIRFGGYTFVGPTALDALDHYDYKLLRTHSTPGSDVYEIKIIPRTKTIPLFDGTVNISGDTYALVGIDVRPNEAFLLPFVREKEIRYRQQFGLYENTFWMPIDIRAEGTFLVGVFGFTFPKITLAQTSVISNYLLNTLIPDSIFHRPRVVVDSSATKFDSTFWLANNVLPLTMVEQHAYQTLDSSQTLEVQFRPGGFAMTLGGGSEGAASFFKSADILFSRVEGFHIGAWAEFDSVVQRSSFHAGLSYGFSDKLVKYDFGTTVFSSTLRQFGLGGEVYRRIDHSPDQGYYGALYNSITSLLEKNDYRNYYRTDGWRGFITVKPTTTLNFECSFVSEWQTTAKQNTNFSILSHSHDYLRSVRVDMHIGPERVPFDFILRNSIDLSIEHSSPSFAGSQFDFTCYHAIASASVPTFGRSYLFPPVMRLRVAAGTSSGALPPQRTFDLESSSSGFGPFGVMHAAGVKEFSGTSYCALSLEHNFRSLLFLALGIPFLYENNIELIVHGGTAHTWNHGQFPLSTTDGWYYEAGFGLNRIFELIRTDVTWRLSSPQQFKFTFCVASLL
jgi:hypothetical protein